MDPQPLSDEVLARQSQAGSLDAFEELVHRYERRIYGFVFQCCHRSADAGDVTQDTFVRAFQAIGQFDTRRAFCPWLFTIARRKCIDHFRATPPPADETPPDVEDHEDPAELAARREERENLWQLARRLLPAVQFQALWLRYAEDMSIAEVAQVLRKTQTHVKVLLFRARRSLGRELENARQTFPRSNEFGGREIAPARDLSELGCPGPRMSGRNECGVVNDSANLVAPLNAARTA
jgi:RNA polymerase sigma-70 factor (ECF subfamily)